MLKISRFLLKNSHEINLKVILQKVYKSTVNGNNKTTRKFTQTKSKPKNITKLTNAEMGSNGFFVYPTSSYHPNPNCVGFQHATMGTQVPNFNGYMNSGNLNYQYNMVGGGSNGYATQSTNQPIYSPFRQWIPTHLGSQLNQTAEKCITDNGLSFTLLSYNILAQELLLAHPELYTQCQRETLDWKYRLQKLQAEILTMSPDVLCLQEVQESHLIDIVAAVRSLNMDYVYKKKTGDLRSDGCAIFYNRNLFEMVHCHGVEYFQPDSLPLDRHNIGLIVKLSPKLNPAASFIVSTTHLLFNPRREDVRLAQIQVILAELDRFSVLHGQSNTIQKNRVPIILTGDFNLQPYSAPYDLITKGNLPYENLSKRTLEFTPKKSMEQVLGKEFLPSHLGITDNCQHIDLIRNHYVGTPRLFHTLNNPCVPPKEDLVVKFPRLFSTGCLSHELNLTSVYQHRTRDNQKEGSTFQDNWVTVDYMFYSKYFSPKINSICEGYLKLLSRYALPSVSQCKQIGTIPNSHYGSDHFTLGAKFYLKYPGKQ